MGKPQNSNCHEICRLSLLLGWLLLGAAHCQGREPLRLLVMDYVVGYAPYLVRREASIASDLGAQEDGSLAGFEGELIDAFNCIAERGDFTFSLDSVPLKRGIHSVRSGAADLLLPTVYLPQLGDLLGDDLTYSAELHRGYWSLVALASQEQLLRLPLAADVRLATVRGSRLNGLLKNVAGQSYLMDTPGLRGLFKLLLAGRIDVASMTTPWPGEQLQNFGGQALSGLTLQRLSYRALLSRGLTERRPELLPRLNTSIEQCRHHFKVIAYNPFRRELNR